MLGPDRDSLSDASAARTQLFLAEACKLSYRSEEEIGRIVGEIWDWERPGFLRGDGLRGFAATGDAAVVVAFRGADSLADWVANADLSLVRRRYGRVHGGVSEIFGAIASQVAERVEEGRRAGKPVWLAGHGVGGAVATIAAVELTPDAADLHLVTFGQPRVLDGRAAGHADAVLGERYWRVVNADDAVPRLPPGLAHAGALHRFDLSGTLEVEPPGGNGSAPLDEDAFDTLRKTIRGIYDGSRRNLDQAADESGSAMALFVSSVEGLVDGIPAHRIDRYIAALRSAARQSGQPADGREPALSVEVPLAHRRPAPDEAPPRDGPTARAPGTDGDAAGPRGAGTAAEGDGGARLIPAVLRLADPGWSAPPGLRTQSRFASICTVQATEEQLKVLGQDPGVSSIEVSREAGIEDAVSPLSFTGGNVVHRPPIAERGDRCVFALIDTGIDVLHEAFSDRAGGTRIRGIWHQAARSGPTPHDVDPQRFSQNYGRLYTGDEIDAVVRAFHQNGTPVADVLRDDLSFGTGGHGTHVASIGAGGAVGDDFVGMAPDALIVAVLPSMSTIAGGPRSLGYSMSHIDALSFLRSVAGGGNALLRERLPMVVNVSLGMNAGPHDGLTPLEVAFDMATAQGPGFVIVKSAGNERGHGGHARITVAHNAVEEIRWTSDNEARRQDYIELWYDESDDLAFELFDPGGRGSGRVDRLTPQTTATLGANRCKLSLTTNHRDNGDNQLVVEILSDDAAIQPGEWRLDVIGARVRSDAGVVDAWVERINGRPVRFLKDDDALTLSIPGTAETVISVAACDTGDPPRLTRESSHGLTRSGQAKPDIAAPGLDVVGARSADADLSALTQKSGTSMAAPYVAGAIVLALSRREKQQKRPPTARQVLSALKLSARDYTGGHSIAWGYGKLDAAALLREIDAITP